ncbi:hypothetical protein TASIC1_0001021200 [Trichoderma asperellum]|uniref:Uncharacterized protein n=1 Tax=Trichoderma asperellum TaxID=101201 RepID=A0A6V8QHW2_TRIAP|nr:hypothetical protein TASIC1_0001021200 [Trichoderma asperellum]
MHGVHALPSCLGRATTSADDPRRKGAAVAEAFHGRTTDAATRRTAYSQQTVPQTRRQRRLAAGLHGCRPWPVFPKRGCALAVLVSANHVSMRVGVRWMRGRSAGWLSPQSSLASRRSGGRPAQTARTVSGLGPLETSTARNGHGLLIAAWPAPGWTVTVLSPTTLTPPGCNRLEARLGIEIFIAAPEEPSPASSSLWTRARINGRAAGGEADWGRF